MSTCGGFYTVEDLIAGERPYLQVDPDGSIKPIIDWNKAVELAAAKLDIKNLPPGTHLMHIHEFAKCEPPDFMSAGAHFNPTGTSHAEHDPPGIPAGDIPNFVLTVAADGTAHTSVIAPSVTLGTDSNSVFSNGGTSLVIHAMAVEVSASAPPRIACGVITRTQ
ncbi:MAG: superoxide dismutase family protein [Candidatus Acidiferrales bacterium]